MPISQRGARAILAAALTIVPAASTASPCGGSGSSSSASASSSATHSAAMQPGPFTLDVGLPGFDPSEKVDEGTTTADITQSECNG